MSDLIERLRNPSCFLAMDEEGCVCCDDNVPTMREAADRIAELEAALRQARRCISKHQGGCANGCFDRTGRALGEDDE